MKVSTICSSCLTITLLFSSVVHGAAPVLLQRVTVATSHDVIIDTRPLSSCRKSSLEGAMCLPVEDVMAPNRRLANWSGLLWLLGTAGLTGEERILVVGEQPARREVIAALLFLAGQSRVSLLESKVSELIADADQSYNGAARATTRTSVYKARMRSDLIVLRSELHTLLDTNVVIVDGRSEAEYFGASIRASRGGHIAGAIHSPLTDWRSNAKTTAAAYRSTLPVAYAHDTYESLVYFAAMQATGVSAKVYLSGWVEWALDSRLPVDSVSYPVVHPATVSSAVKSDKSSALLSPINKTGLAVTALVFVCLLVASFSVGRKFPLRKV